ncbi:chemotaxis protein CheW [Spirulina sp. 06S082]|uniref:chemotaxis protein CheW n=1 Tax=Spirulina sp. 06S082 TaxID=3110248 RepID=UPI002B2206C4|nr:chemotaxis protein CheW [Spirulina sp. 06S082]MEA5471502.1 chemotaxis protein CheW [Spirulina sp. 06S082]
MMSQQVQLEQKRILQLVREGNPKAIASFFNHKLKTKGIRARVIWQSNILVVTLEAEEIPDRQFSLAVIEKGLKRLRIPALAGVDVMGYIQGRPQPSWRDRLQFDSTKLGIDLDSWLESGSSLDDAIVEFSLEEKTPQEMGPRDRPVSPPRPEEKFLGFQIAIENAALFPVENIQEILQISPAQILAIPDMPEFILGIYNWRGEMLWLIDLDRQLGLGDLQNSLETSLNVIVAKIENRVLGLVVKRVDEIESLVTEGLQSPVGLFTPGLEHFISGYLQQTGRIVLNPQTILNRVN